MEGYMKCSNCGCIYNKDGYNYCIFCGELLNEHIYIYSNGTVYLDIENGNFYYDLKELKRKAKKLHILYSDPNKLELNIKIKTPCGNTLEDINIDFSKEYNSKSSISPIYNINTTSSIILSFTLKNKDKDHDSKRYILLFSLNNRYYLIDTNETKEFEIKGGKIDINFLFLNNENKFKSITRVIDVDHYNYSIDANNIKVRYLKYTPDGIIQDEMEIDKKKKNSTYTCNCPDNQSRIIDIVGICVIINRKKDEEYRKDEKDEQVCLEYNLEYNDKKIIDHDIVAPGESVIQIKKNFFTDIRKKENFIIKIYGKDLCFINIKNGINIIDFEKQEVPELSVDFGTSNVSICIKHNKDGVSIEDYKFLPIYFKSKQDINNNYYNKYQMSSLVKKKKEEELEKITKNLISNKETTKIFVHDRVYNEWSPTGNEQFQRNIKQELFEVLLKNETERLKKLKYYMTILFYEMIKRSFYYLWDNNYYYNAIRRIFLPIPTKYNFSAIARGYKREVMDIFKSVIQGLNLISDDIKDDDFIFVDEARAAFEAFKRLKHLDRNDSEFRIIIDIGGGTTDIVCFNKEDKIEGLLGASFGGEEILNVFKKEIIKQYYKKEIKKRDEDKARQNDSESVIISNEEISTKMIQFLTEDITKEEDRKDIKEEYKGYITKKDDNESIIKIEEDESKKGIKVYYKNNIDKNKLIELLLDNNRKSLTEEIKNYIESIIIEWLLKNFIDYLYNKKSINNKNSTKSSLKILLLFTGGVSKFLCEEKDGEIKIKGEIRDKIRKEIEENNRVIKIRKEIEENNKVKIDDILVLPVIKNNNRDISGGKLVALGMPFTLDEEILNKKEYVLLARERNIFSKIKKGEKINKKTDICLTFKCFEDKVIDRKFLNQNREKIKYIVVDLGSADKFINQNILGWKFTEDIEDKGKIMVEGTEE